MAKMSVMKENVGHYTKEEEKAVFKTLQELPEDIRLAPSPLTTSGAPMGQGIDRNGFPVSLQMEGTVYFSGAFCVRQSYRFVRESA